MMAVEISDFTQNPEGMGHECKGDVSPTVPLGGYNEQF
jgi:hypothetical protein